MYCRSDKSGRPCPLLLFLNQVQVFIVAVCMHCCEKPKTLQFDLNVRIPHSHSCPLSVMWVLRMPSKNCTQPQCSNMRFPARELWTMNRGKYTPHVSPPMSLAGSSDYCLRSNRLRANRKSTASLPSLNRDVSVNSVIAERWLNLQHHRFPIAQDFERISFVCLKPF